MTLKNIARRAKTLWSIPGVPESTNRHNRRQWVRSVALLGPRWKLHAPVPSETLKASAALLNNQHWSPK